MHNGWHLDALWRTAGAMFVRERAPLGGYRRQPLLCKSLSFPPQVLWRATRYNQVATLTSTMPPLAAGKLTLWDWKMLVRLAFSMIGATIVVEPYQNMLPYCDATGRLTIVIGNVLNTLKHRFIIPGCWHSHWSVHPLMKPVHNLVNISLGKK